MKPIIQVMRCLLFLLIIIFQIQMSYATEKAADAAAKWIRETCGVDISTGLNVGPTP